MTEHEAIPVRTRNVGTLHPEGDDSMIIVDHVYMAEGSFRCDDCGKPGHDPGMVGLFVSEGDADDDGNASVSLTAAEALVLANRLQRAAGLILESGEDHPDIEREAARFSIPDELPGLPEAGAA